MDNVIQNINIEDIVPNNYHHQYEMKEIEGLVSSIKKHGMLEPITLRPKGNKYEVILGNKRYKAATIIGLKTIPAMIKEIDDNKAREYSTINNDNLLLNTASFSNLNQKNLDVINLSKLNKEYERDELKMNNNQFDNNINQSINNTEPTFGGRFFPSLEDEPTNMSFSGGNIEQMIPNQPTNNFIDLTDLNIGSGIQQVPQNNIEPPQPINNNIPQPKFNNDQALFNQNVNQNLDNATPMNQISINDNNNIINLESLKQNPEMMTHPVSPEINIDNDFQDVIADFHPNGNIAPNQFEQPTISEPALMPNFESVPAVDQIANQVYNIPQEVPNQVINNQPINNQEFVQPNFNSPIVDNVMPAPSTESIMPQSNIEPVMPMQEQIQPESSTMPIQQKDVLPVINTLKALAVNLETFGYTIRITDEDLPTSYKITIEVDK